MLSERLLKLRDSFIRLEVIIIILENGSVKNVLIRMPQTVSPCIRCAGPAVKNLRPALNFQKIRAFSDFALEVPYNPAKIADDMNMILESLSEKETTGLLEQIAHLEEDVTKY